MATSLQGREFLISETLAAVRILEGQLAMMAKDKFLEDLWSKAKGVEKDLDWEEPAPKRRRQPTEKLRDQGVTADPISETVIDKAIREAKAGIGGLLTSVKERFADSGFRFVLQVNEVLLSAVKGIFIEDSICAIVIHLKDDLDIHRLRRHLGYLPQLCPKAVSVMEVILAVKGAPDLVKGMVSEVEKLLNIVATMATSSATPERSFSTLKRVNTWLRTTMGQDRLSNLALLHFHQKETEQLSTKEIVRCFIMVKSNSRQLVFGQVIEE